MRFRIAGGRYRPPTRESGLSAFWMRWDAPCQGLVQVTIAAHCRRSCAVSGEIPAAQ